MSTAGSAAPLPVRGAGSLLYDQDGRPWLDLICGYGSAFLGHSHPAVTAALQAQAAQVLSCGRFPTEHQAAVDARLAPLLPAGLRAAGLLSTGMEAAEFALRVAATQTGRHEFAGFACSMHGKSALTAALCWSNAPLHPGGLHTLPLATGADEAHALQALDELLQTRRIAALFCEPIQGSNGAHEASAAFYRQAAALCRQHGTLLVMDEILTGLYRTGAAFHCQQLALTPDILLFAKALGNGFPISGIALAPHVELRPQALPGSTFAGNPLALAAAQATLDAMAALPMTALVDGIAQIVRSHFAGLGSAGLTLRGRGALWCVELAPQLDMARAVAAIAAAGVLVTQTGRSIRLLPAANMPAALLHEACASIAAACLAASH